jgi:hypothetical protein
MRAAYDERRIHAIVARVREDNPQSQVESSFPFTAVFIEANAAQALTTLLELPEIGTLNTWPDEFDPITTRLEKHHVLAWPFCRRE